MGGQNKWVEGQEEWEGRRAGLVQTPRRPLFFPLVQNLTVSLLKELYQLFWDFTIRHNDLDCPYLISIFYMTQRTENYLLKQNTYSVIKLRKARKGVHKPFMIWRLQYRDVCLYYSNL